MGRILAIDFGTKRCGLAVTDRSGMIANPLEVVAGDKLLPFLKEYVQREDVETIVLGKPRDLTGNDSGPVEALNNLSIALRRAFPEIPLERVDERFTSKMAADVVRSSGKSKKEREKKENLDLISAVIILQSFLEARNLRNH